MMQDPATPTPYYTMPELLTLLAAVGTLLTALIGGVANAWIAIKTSTTIKQGLKENTDISAATLIEAKVISGHVNSERSKLDERLVSKDRENEILSKQLTEQSQTAALLAASTAQVIRQRQPDPNGPRDRRADDKLTEQTLAQIETNTAATAEGIQDLKDGSA